MIKRIVFFITFLISMQIFASNHGIYVKLFSDLSVDISKAGDSLLHLLSDNGYRVLSYRNVETPQIVREENTDGCKFRVKQIVFTSDSYLNFLTSYDKKYLLASFLKIALYENEKGLQINMTDPETINRIVFNDLWEEDQEAKYNEVVNKSKEFKEKLIALIHSAKLGTEVIQPQPPIRSDEDLRESAKDMFMMVGPMTFFNDEDQFPLIYQFNSNDPKADLLKLREDFENNLAEFNPSEEDREYRLTKSDNVLKWKIIATVFSPDSNAMLIGITRPRTEGLSFHIAGLSRETDSNGCPGIDHAAAFPIEVLAVFDNGKIKIYTAREMFRMDMYFWDAGMSAFMKHMSMPSMLDESLRKALLNNKYNPN